MGKVTGKEAMGGMMGLFYLLAAAVWIVALCDTILRSTLDPLGRVLLIGALILVPPVGLLAWLVAKKRAWREGRQLTTG